MPQLDIFTFLPQVFWFLTFYFGFYILFFRSILCRILISLRVRNKLLNLYSTKVNGSLNDYLFYRSQYISLLFNYFETVHNLQSELNYKIYLTLKLNGFLKLINFMDLPYMTKALQSLYIKIELLKKLEKLKKKNVD